jgi:hypothetical protein
VRQRLSQPDAIDQGPARLSKTVLTPRSYRVSLPRILISGSAPWATGRSVLLLGPQCTRAFTRRVVPSTPNNWPNHAHASAYGAALHYLKVAAEMGAAAAKQSGSATVARMKQTPTDDDAFGKGSIARTDAGCFPPTCSRSKSPPKARAHGICSSWWLRPPRPKRCAPSLKAAAR